MQWKEEEQKLSDAIAAASQLKINTEFQQSQESASEADLLSSNSVVIESPATMVYVESPTASEKSPGFAKLDVAVSDPSRHVKSTLQQPNLQHARAQQPKLTRYATVNDEDDEDCCL